MAKLIKLRPLSTLSLVDKVEIRLTEYFKENNLKIGDSIPKELEFAEALGVSRTVIREATLRLRTIGMIESKKHKGMVLAQPDIIQNFEKVLESNLLGEKTLKDIFELRLILEMGMADLLFARKTEKDIEELSHIVSEQGEKEHDTSTFSLEYEVSFHGKLYQMSNNSTLQRFQDLLLPVFKYVHSNALPNAKEYDYSNHTFITHKDLLNHLIYGTPESFRTDMRRHLEPHFDRILNKFKS